MDSFNIFKAAFKLSQKYPTEAEKLKPYVLDQDTEWSDADRRNVLDNVAEIFLHDNCTFAVAKLFEPLLLELLNRCTKLILRSDDVKHKAVCCLLGRLIRFYPEVARFAYEYFQTAPQLFQRYLDENDNPPKKKQKIKSHCQDSLQNLLVAAVQLLSFDIDYFREVWDWSSLSTFVNNESTDVKWLACRCMFLIFNTSREEQNAITETFMSKQEDLQLNMKYSLMFSPMPKIYASHSFGVDLESNNVQHSKLFTIADLSENVVNVEGILFNRFSTEVQSDDSSSLVLVPSMQQALQEIALAVSTGIPVLLQGPVGCGKTSLVEHLAFLTGRNPHHNLLKIQLGDQMDSKLLIGSYICTETFGEFVWQPGILTQAMTEGYWLLLEDIDCAPMEIVSTLAPIIQSRSLVLPGQSSPITAHAGFQLFATQRLLIGHDQSYLEFKSNADMLDKMWRKVTISNLTNEELKIVIKTNWPVLVPFVERILNIYHHFSSDASVNRQCENSERLSFLSSVKRNRLISTRDLFKFCKRIAKGFILNSEEIAARNFQHSMDCFCNSLPSVSDRRVAAEFIGVQFNFLKSKAMHFYLNFKSDVQVFASCVQIGRAYLPIKPTESTLIMRSSSVSFAYTQQACQLLEKVSVAVEANEPVLLVGETGTGKTCIVQYLASITNNKLSVINMNQQSDSTDLLGGFKPVDLKLVVAPIRDEFLSLFESTFNANVNEKFLGHIRTCFHAKKWSDLLNLMLHVQKSGLQTTSTGERATSPSREVNGQWRKLGRAIQKLQLQIQQSKSPLAFSFIEGTLVKAMKNGEWLLLDEINLAEAETLQCLGGLLESDVDSVYLLEKGDKEPVRRHPDFRIFACMNPATDVGKKELPAGIRNRFTEFFMEELEDKRDLMVLVETYLSGLALDQSVVESIVDFYLYIRNQAVQKLNDGTGHRPHYSLRTLCRALKCAAPNSCGTLHRSLFEALSLSFLSQLDRPSIPIVTDAIKKFVIGKKHLPALKQTIPEPLVGSYVPVQGYWISAGAMKPGPMTNYIITPSVQQNLQNLARIVSVGRYPVLIQGETSVGKTSLVKYLASLTGNHCVRVNNHEHTDIQEYLGSYCANNEGKLVYKEGILVEAMRKGYWIILDELNLAPTEVMEALNRVLDDNRELFITETQETVKAHPKFMVFATQNPPGLYGGRKLLSRAFRNRFIELYFDEIPADELKTILEKRCSVPRSYCGKMVSVMQDLQIKRRESGIFAGKQSYITLRDLFRWGERYRLADDPTTKFHDWDKHLAEEGYMLLAGRVRKPEETEVIRETLKNCFKRTVDVDKLFKGANGSTTTSDVLKDIEWESSTDEFRHIVWTTKMRRLAILLGKAIKFEEPVLLVGDTGSGKTTICQMYAEFSKKKLYSVNCHMHSESADFLGNLRPVRSHDEKNEKLFEWVDGPLVTAMQEGNFFLIDEISLADDSVLERLNSVLETQRELRLTEKGGDDDESIIKAHKKFRIMATMNPGGDYGKKELSPALRNRFTEIWCPSDLSRDDMFSIIENNIRQEIGLMKNNKYSGFGDAITNFLSSFRSTELGGRATVSIRDILTWVRFINSTVDASSGWSHLTPCEAFVHGACLVFIDGLGISLLSESSKISETKTKCYQFLLGEIENHVDPNESFEKLEQSLQDRWQNYDFVEKRVGETSYFGFGPFVIPSGDRVTRPENYCLDTPTAKCNVVRILRAMQLWKPILLEGCPGVGKTSLVTTLAGIANIQLVRINLSEQTDIADLFGTDLPVDGGKCGEFAWRDGPLLRALKEGSWILLDELNLASQSVLEGLNACLDHRGEIYIPELGKTFSISNNSTRIFACQNPFKQGGSRKGLPRSFLNRFTQVMIEPMTSDDIRIIVHSAYPVIPEPIINSIIEFNGKIIKYVNNGVMSHNQVHSWNFNLRDIFRWCDVLVADSIQGQFNPAEFAPLIYASRMRSIDDKKMVNATCCSHFDSTYLKLERNLELRVFDNVVQVGHSFLPRKGHVNFNSQLLYPFHNQLFHIESLMKCLQMNWLPILIGPSSAGKSSIVHLVATLTGHPLKVLTINAEMDTTELLGGFEQVNPRRKIDVIEDLRPLLEKAAAVCLIRNEPSHADLLHTILKCLHRFYSTKHNSFIHSSEEDISDLNKFLTELSKKISIVIEKKHMFSNDNLDLTSVLYLLQEKLTQVSARISSAINMQIGGHFEWVDSILVDAVQKGYWLLLEDVNMCSPAVLDRLNGLLEPNGVLTIFEQGTIDCDGNPTVRTISPHPNFRLIFTMNPTNGEISPAMRNRGVEIAMISEVSSTDVLTDTFDCLSFMHSKGLYDPKVMLCILKIYRLFLDKDVGAIPTSHDLHNVIVLCSQLLRKNLSVQESISKSFGIAFINNLLNPTVKMNCHMIVNGVLREGNIPTGANPLSMPSHFPFPTSLTPSTLDFQFSSLSAATSQQSTLLITIFRRFLNTALGYPETSMHVVHISAPPLTYPSVTNPGQWIRLLSVALRLFFEVSSLKQWHGICYAYKSVLENLKSMCDFERDSRASVTLPCIKNVEAAVIGLMQSHVRVWTNSSDGLFQKIGLMSDVSKLSQKDDVPICPNLNFYLCRRLMSNMQREQPNLDIDQANSDLETSANRFLLLLLLTSHEQTENFIGKEFNKEGKSNFSLYELPKHFTGTSSEERAILSAVKLIIKLTPEVHNALEKFIIKEDSSSIKKNYQMLWETIIRYRRFLKHCHEPRFHLRNFRHDDEILFHFLQLKKQLTTLFSPGFSQMSIPSSLDTIMRNISCKLNLENRSSEKIKWKVVKLFGYPPAFSSESCALSFIDAMEIYQKINIHSMLLNSSRDIKNLKIAFTNGPKWIATLVSVVNRSLSRPMKDVTFSDMHGLKLQLRDLGFISGDEDDDDIMELCQQPARKGHVKDGHLELQLELLPFHNYFFQHAEAMLLSIYADKCKGQLANRPSPIWINFLSDLGIKKLHYSPAYISQYNLLGNMNKGTFSACLASFLHSFQCGSFVVNHDAYFSWNKSTSSNHPVENPITLDFQSPVLTINCLRLLGSSDLNSLSLPMEYFFVRRGHIEVMKSILWRSRDSLGNHSIWKNLTHIVSSLFDFLVDTMTHMWPNIPTNATLSEKFEHIWKDMKEFEIFREFRCRNNMLEECKQSIPSFHDAATWDHFEVNWNIGRCFVKIGLLTLALFAPIYSRDPIRDYALKYDSYSNMGSDCDLECQLRKWQADAASGQDLSKIEFNFIFAHLRQMAEGFYRKAKEMRFKISYRIDNYQFENVKQQIDSFVAVLGSPENVLKTLEHLHDVVKSGGKMRARVQKEVMRTVSTMIESMKNFTSDLTSKFPTLRDLFYPFLTGIEMLMLGFNMLKRYISRAILPMKDVEDFLIVLGSFPSTQKRGIKSSSSRLLNLPQQLSSKETLQSLSHLKTRVGCTEQGSGSQKLLQSALLEAVNEAILRKHQLSADFLHTADTILKHYYQAIEKQDDALRMKKFVEESLYAHKTTSYVGEESSEKMAAKEIKELFPSYQEEFNEIKEFSLDSDEPVKKDEVPDVNLSISTEDTMEVWKCHATLMSSLLQSEQEPDSHMKPLLKTVQQPDFVSPFLLRYQLLKSLLPVLKESDDCIDPHLIGGHLLSASYLQFNTDVLPYDLQNISEGNYDIYRDPNPTEVITFIPVLEDLISRVEFLGREFPDHPVLLQITKIVNRIQSFPITSPLMKFITGFELIILSINEWQMMSHKKISLAPELESLTQKVIAAHKLEQKCWSRCLDSVVKKQYSECTKMWFLVYSVVFVEDKKETGDVLNSLKQFIEDSTIGQFPARLALVKTFLNHLTVSTQKGSIDKIQHILCNVYDFYKQFLPLIESKIESIRKPIEKEVKNFTKISRWNDSNFYSVKKAVEKSHQTLHKFMRKFEFELKQPARKYFQIDVRSGKKVDDSEQNVNFDASLFTPDKIVSVVLNEEIKHPNLDNEPLFEGISHYSEKSNKLCSKILKKYFLLPSKLNVLDVFSCDMDNIPQTIKNMDMKKKDEDEKAAANRIKKNAHSKRIIVSDLLKELTFMGLSYRKGEIFNTQTSEKNNALLAPNCYIGSWKRFDLSCSHETNTSSIWQDASHLYFQCVAQFSVLQSVVNSPNPALNDTSILKKFSGFSAHVYQIMIEQRHHLVTDMDAITKLNTFVNSLSKIMRETSDNTKKEFMQNQKRYYPPQHLVVKWKEVVGDLLLEANTALHQFSILLKCCPESSGDTNLWPLDVSALSRMTKKSGLWVEWTTKITSCLEQLGTITAAITPVLQLPNGLQSWSTLLAIQESLQQLETLLLNLGKDLAICFQDCSADNSFTTVLRDLYFIVYRQCNSFKEDIVMCQESESRNMALSDVDLQLPLLSGRLLQKVLKSIENLYSLCKENHNSQKDDSEIYRHLFTKKICSHIQNLRECLNLPEIFTLIRGMEKSMEDFQSSNVHVPYLQRYAFSIVPVMQQYSQLLKLYLMSSVKAHHSSCKLLSSMLETFLEVAQKGFGTPAEKKVDGGSGTVFKDIEQGGLGEGEGCTDVSKDVDNEGQLDEARREGDEKEDDKNDTDIKDEKDGIEMSEDFDGNVFSPEARGNEDDEDETTEEGEDFDETELDKKMGDVNNPDSDKLDERIWGDESDEEDELGQDDSGKGVAQNKESQLAAKDDKKKDIEKKESGNQPIDECPDLKNEEEYNGEHEDPLIDAPPLVKPEDMNLPEEMQIDNKELELDKVDDNVNQGDEDENENPMDIDSMKTQDNDPGASMDQEQKGAESDTNEGSESEEKDESGEPVEMLPEEQEEDGMNQNDNHVPDKSVPNVTEDQVQPIEDVYGATHDFDQPMMEQEDWGGSGEDIKDQHQEGQSAAKESTNFDAAHAGKKSAFSARNQADSEKQKHSRKLPDKDRTLGESDQPLAQKLNVRDSSSKQENLEDFGKVDKASEYKHVQNKSENDLQVLDSATREQVLQQPPSSRPVQASADSDDDDIIEIDSSSEEDDDEEMASQLQNSKFVGSSTKKGVKNSAAAEASSSDEEMELEGDVVQTLGARRHPESTIHTQQDVWTNLSRQQHVQHLRVELEGKVKNWHNLKKSYPDSHLGAWSDFEIIVTPLVHELCEQLRLVLEPTKMSKMKGDYRTGKRLNMRKIIPYIASQFRKDKIWLRRTKPSKRQYQILLAVDDSYSMADNHSKELAFESLVLLAKSLSYIEAGELGILSFGEDVELLQGFGDPFTDSSGNRVLDSFSFAQKKTRVAKLLDHVTRIMTDSRGAQSRLISKEIAQLLVIISDGRGIFSENEETVYAAVRRARFHNIFMVFVILDSPLNKDSILDIQCPEFGKSAEVKMRPYMEKFPFPFYIILRSIEVLPQVLGEALRQWFELVTSADR